MTEEDVARGKEEFKKRIQSNKEIDSLLKRRAKEFTEKSKVTPVLTRMDEFIQITRLQKLDHGDTLELIQWLWEYVTAINNNLATTLQYLDDNMQNIAKNTTTELSAMKTKVANVQKEVKEPIYKMAKDKQEFEAHLKKIAGSHGVV